MEEEKIKISDNFHLNINSKIPYYYQLKQYIIQEIESGLWKPGQMLPYENQLCQFFSISRTVVRQALQELKNEGYITTRKGKGTYVAEPEISGNIIQSLLGFYETWKSLGFKVDISVLKLEQIRATEKVANSLHLKNGEEVILLKRMYKLNDKPYSIITNYMPYEPLKDIMKEDFKVNGLTTILDKKYNVKLTHGLSFIEIVLASKEEAELLHIKKGAPLFFFEGISFSSGETPMVFFQSTNIGERSKIRIELRKNNTFGKNDKSFQGSVPSLIWDSK